MQLVSCVVSANYDILTGSNWLDLLFIQMTVIVSFSRIGRSRTGDTETDERKMMTCQSVSAVRERRRKKSQSLRIAVSLSLVSSHNTS